MKQKTKTSRVKFQEMIGHAVSHPGNVLTWVDLDTQATGTVTSADYKPQRYLNENLMNKALRGRKNARFEVTLDFGGVFTTATLIIEERAPSLKKQLADTVIAPAPAPIAAPAPVAQVWGADTFYEDPLQPMPFWHDLNLIDCYKRTGNEAAFKDLERRYKGLIVRQTKFIFNNMPSAQMGYEWEDIASEMMVCFIKAIRYINIDYKREHGLESSLGTVFERYSTAWRNQVLSYWNNKKRSAGIKPEKTTTLVTDKATGEEKEVEFKLDKGESYANQNPGLLHTNYVGDYTLLAQKGGQCALLDREKMIEEELKRTLSNDEMTLYNFLRDKAPRMVMVKKFGESQIERLKTSLRQKAERVAEVLDFSLT